MGALPAIQAGVSIIGGIASMSAKNKAAAAQREQLAAQSYQQAQQAVSSEAILASQQQLAQTQYQTSVLSQLASFQQADFGLQSQQALAAFKSQQDAYAIQTQELQQSAELANAAQQLEKQGVQTSMAADQQRGASDAATASAADQGTQALQQLEAQLSAEQRKALSLESSGRLATGSSEVAQRKQVMQRISTALSTGLEMDSVQVQRALQAMNEQELAGIGERLGLLDNSQSVESVATNLRLLRDSSDLALGNLAANDQATQGALSFARQNNLVNAELDARSLTDSYAAQNYSLGVQRSTNTNTAQSVAKSNATASGQIKGAGLLDVLNTAVNAAGAASSLFANRPAPTPRPGTLYSGFPTANSNVG